MSEAIGPLLGGIGSLIGGCSVLAAFLFIQRRTVDAQWVDGFRQIYAEFWKDDTISEVRRWIVSNSEYESLRVVLVERAKTIENNLDTESNKILEKIDKFCALMLRVKSFEHRAMSDHQRQLFKEM